MFNPLLKTFVEVAECGSFLKASEKLFISTPAILKQINLLEKNLKLKLFERSNKGVKLTDEGKIIFDNAKNFMKMSDEIIFQAKNLESKKIYSICIGSSILYPANFLIDLWNKISGNSDFRLKIVPFEDFETTSAAHVIGKKCDLVFGAYDATKDTGDCKFFQLGNYNFCLAMSKKHILAKKNLIKPDDLSEQKLLIMQEGNSPQNDKIRHFLQKNYPQAILEDVPFHYSVEHFHRCEEENCLLLTLECWKNVHHALVTIPFDVEFKLPYGILYSKDANKNILQFIKILQDSLTQNFSSYD